jgi:hypothetical protein
MGDRTTGSASKEILVPGDGRSLLFQQEGTSVVRRVEH